MWRLQIVLVPPSAQDTVSLLDAHMNMDNTSQLAFSVVQFNENIVTNTNNNNNDWNSSATSLSSPKTIQPCGSNDFLNYLPTCKKFLHFTNSCNTLLQLSNEILAKFDKLYPNSDQSIEIISLQDRHGCDLDSQFVIKDVFETDSVVLVILKDELYWNRNQQVSLLQSARQRKRINKPSRKSTVFEKKNETFNENLSPTPNKDSMYLIAKNSLKQNFINKSRVSTPLMNEILPVVNKHDTLNEKRVSIRFSPVVIASEAHKPPKNDDHANGGNTIYGDDSNKENISSSNEQPKNGNFKSHQPKNLNVLYNSSEDPDFELTDDNSRQVSYDSIDTDFQLSTTSSTNSDMHMQYFKPFNTVRSPRKSSLEIKVQNKTGEDLQLNDRDVSENYRRIETFSDEEDHNDMENDQVDSFINNSKRASVGFRDIDSDLDNVSFNSDIGDAVQSTQTTKNAVSIPYSRNDNRLHKNQEKDDLFHLVENEFPDKSSGKLPSKSPEKGATIQDTIRKLNSFKPIEENRVKRNSIITESSLRKFAPTIKDKDKFNDSEKVRRKTKYSNNLNGSIFSNEVARVGKIKVIRKTNDVEAKVREFKKKRSMGNKSLKDIFANAGKTSKVTSSIKVVKLTRDPVYDSKKKAEATSNNGKHLQDPDNMLIKESTVVERTKGQAIPSSLKTIPQFKRVKVTRSHSSSSSSSSVSSGSSSESSSSDGSDDSSNSRNVQVKKINFRTSHEPTRDSSEQSMLDVHGNDPKTSKYQTPKYVQSDEDNE
ncbi:Tof2p SKDI_11G2220 [Saccharomyces kudriavzevii IFO 1802]|uniref:Nucleolar protein Dnt1-like N-terminal domain-containing protein n=1 Tax=Saccharomyces kudriavzevii (strain ATCC MYA-4449 / AS 2.2408 / CBS 8840 / NBRC 1802 / NCYC 2889) TaxID=226230 RepID=A0AA35J3I6_SACK1|nr:uncharacterized protein SKDI_11G2220 [Saccharomyces kudriavzevii IFO 1802]CAI4045083.1 hypothetical protein SKDI_11G2220 [Saccharomyces kudriavzevii IFO 1802]